MDTVHGAGGFRVGNDHPKEGIVDDKEAFVVVKVERVWKGVKVNNNSCM